jgi:hypothetical protein
MGINAWPFFSYFILYLWRPLCIPQGKMGQRMNTDRQEGIWHMYEINIA